MDNNDINTFFRQSEEIFRRMFEGFHSIHDFRNSESRGKYLKIIFIKLMVYIF